MVTCCCERCTILMDCYEIFTENVKIICLSFHGSVAVSASCNKLFTDTSELLRMLAIDYELAICKDS